MSSRILAAVAWPYANGPRHIGHVSGFGVPSDVFSRYQRMAGQRRADGVGHRRARHRRSRCRPTRRASPRSETADKYHRVIAEDLQALGLLLRPVHPHDDAATTTRSCRSCSGRCTTTATWSRKTADGRDLARPPDARCPTATSRAPARICGYDGARGDQCDNCGRQLDPIDLINPRSKINGETPEFVETEHFFLDLPALAEALGEWLATRTDWRPNVHEVQPEPAQGAASAGHHPRPRLGRADPAGGLARTRR